MKNTAGIALLSGLVSCAGSHGLPYINEYPGVTVVLVESEQELPHPCRALGRIHAEDGWVESGRWAYEGTEDRALQRLIHEAIWLNGNYVVLHRHAFSETIPLDASRGRAFRVEGVAYDCSPTSVNMLPNVSVQGAQLILNGDVIEATAGDRAYADINARSGILLE